MRTVPRSFFARPTLEVAHDLIGRILLVSSRGRVCGGLMVETEAYIGEDDKACHANCGQTNRNRVMYGPPGHAYVYFTYGNHWMLNFVTEPEDTPAAILIRALEPTEGLAAIHRRRTNVRRDYDLTNGPGKLTAALGITGRDNGAPLDAGRFRISQARAAMEVSRSGRVGISAAADIPWRFFAAGSPWVSAYRRGTKKQPAPAFRT